MSYVEHCKKHGQHHGEICGECFDDLKVQNTKLREALNDLILYAEELEKRVYRSNEKKIDHPYIRRARKAREGK